MTTRESEIRDAIERAADVIARGRVGVLTGAGVSVESGIPDFRSGGGLWDRFDPWEYATIDAFREDPAKVWQMFRAVEDLLATADPNPAHHALATLESLGVVEGIVTQNIDGLHRRAGSDRVIRIHGDVAALHCIWCGASYDASSVPDYSGGVPFCACGRPLKPTVVLFGELLPGAALDASRHLMDTVDALLVIGTSATVAPVASFPAIVQGRGRPIVEVNLAGAQLDHGPRDVIVRGPAGDVLPALAEAVRARVA